jgi:hypothetical protein
MSAQHDAIDSGSVPPKLSLTTSDKVALWIHFEELGGDDKNKMIATVAWLLAIDMALLLAGISELFPGKDAQRPWVALLCSLVSLVVAVLALYLIVAFGRHAASRYATAQKIQGEIAIPFFPAEDIVASRILARFTSLMDRAADAGPRLFTSAVGSIFDTFAKLTIGVIAMAVATAITSVVVLVTMATR